MSPPVPARSQEIARPTIALALGGGGARGLAHIHAIAALNELGVSPAVIAGSSIGAILGAAMASGLSGPEIHDHVRSVLSRRRTVASRMWRARPGTLAEMMAGGLGVTQFNIERILRVFLPDAIPDDFADLAIPLKVTATDFFGHRLAVLAQGDLPSALAASAAIPAVFKPVIREGTLLIDGGISNPVPFDLLEGDADIVVAIDVVGAPTERENRRPNSIDLMLGANQLLMQSITAAKLQQRRPHVFLRPPVSRFRVLDFLKVDAIMEETASIKEELKRSLGAAIEAAERRG